MSNSSLSSYTKISPNKTSPRKSDIDMIAIHCVVGQVTVEALGNEFSKSSKGASSNYGIGKDGKIATYVEEKDRSWCTGGTDKNGNPIRVNGISGADIDQRAVTIEVASDTTAPYAITDAAYKSLVKLCADICRRNGIDELKWKGDKSLVGKVDQQNIAVHRWFAYKDCPGDYIYNRLGQIASEVNALLKNEQPKPSTKPETSEPTSNYMVRVDITNLRIRKGPGTNYQTNGYTGKGVFTIVEEASGQGSTKGWGKLKSGAGWISLDYAKKI